MRLVSLLSFHFHSPSCQLQQVITMSDLAKPLDFLEPDYYLLEFVALDFTGNNYMPWRIDVEMYLELHGLAETIKEKNTASAREKATATIFLRKHLDHRFESAYEYYTDPSALWDYLKVLFDRQKKIIRPATIAFNDSTLVIIEFAQLDITGKNYMRWAVTAKRHLVAQELEETIKEKNTASSQEKLKVMIFLRKHLDYRFKYVYLNVRDPSTLWKNLKERFNHQKEVIIPQSPAQRLFQTQMAYFLQIRKDKDVVMVMVEDEVRAMVENVVVVVVITIFLEMI